MRPRGSPCLCSCLHWPGTGMWADPRSCMNKKSAVSGSQALFRLLRIDDSFPNRESNQIGLGFEGKFLHQVRTVRLHGPRTDEQLLANLRAREALGAELQHQTLTGGERAINVRFCRGAFCNRTVSVRGQRRTEITAIGEHRANRLQ